MSDFKIPPDWEKCENSDHYIDSNGDRRTADGGFIPFTKNRSIKHPGSKNYTETLGEYRKRVDEVVVQGFHRGDLTWSQWSDYCDGYRWPGLKQAPPEPESNEDEW